MPSPSVTLTWNATTLGGNFKRYEVDRLSAGGVVWDTIAYGITEAVNSFADIEARMGILESYRISVRNTRGILSAPSAVLAATPSVASSPVLAANEVRLTNLVPLDRPAKLTTGRDRQQQTRYGRRFPTVIELPYDRGITVSTNTDLSAASGVVANYDIIRNMLNAAASQWAILYDTGERYWVRPIADDATHELVSYTTAAISLVEVSDKPSIAVFG